MTKKLIFMGILMFFSVFCHSQTNFERGEELFMQNNPQQAVSFLERALMEDPSHIMTYLYLGIVYEQLQRPNDAISVYRRALPNAGIMSAIISNNLGNLYFQRNNNEEAERFYSQAIGFDSAYKSAFLGRANTRIRAGDYSNAVTDYERYLVLEPNSSQRGNIEEVINLIRAEVASEEMRKFLAEAEAQRLAEEEALRIAREEEAARLAKEFEEIKERVNDLIADGKAKLAAGDLTGANELFTEARSIIPASQVRYEAQVLSDIADAYYDFSANNRNTREGFEAVTNSSALANEAIGKDRTQALPYYVLGKIARDANQNEKAINDFREAARLDPANYLYAYELGRMYFMARRINEARDSFQSATRLNPAHEQSWYNLGVTLRALNRNDEALAAYRQAVTLRPDYALAHREIGRILFAKDDTRGAIDAFTRASQLNPGDFVTLCELAAAHSKAGNFAAAENHFNRALSINPNDAQTNYNMAVVKMELKKSNEAINYARRAVDAVPNNAVYVYTLGLANEESGNFDMAVTAYRTAVALDSNYIKPRINLGSLFIENGNISEAIFYLNEAYNIEPGNFEVNNNLGAVYARQENWQSSIRHYESAIASRQDDPVVRLNLARAYVGAGDLEKAKSAYQAVLRITPSNWDAIFELGKTCVTLRQNADARRYLQDLINRNPNYEHRSEAERILRSL